MLLWLLVYLPKHCILMNVSPAQLNKIPITLEISLLCLSSTFLDFSAQTHVSL